MAEQDYWTENAQIAMDEAGIKATPDQIDTIAGVIESAHEFYGQSMGHDVASANFKSEEQRKVEQLESQLKREREMVTCRTCRGTGQLTDPVGTSHVSISECWKCGGKGRHDL